MGSPLSDKTFAETKEPIVVNPVSVNNYQDNTTLDPRTEIEVGNNIILDDGIVEKVKGTTLANSDTPGGAVTGLHRSYGNSTEKIALRLANGTLKSGPAAFATTVLSGLSTSKITPFINVKGKAYGVNETDGLIRYDPKLATGLKTGIIGPNLRKKIAFFESDETWVDGAADTASHSSEEWSGNSATSRKVTVAASSNDSSTYVVDLDLTTFDNGKASDDNDLIVFRTKHTVRSNITAISVYFSCTTAANTNGFYVDVPVKDLSSGDYEWTTHRIKKGAFIKFETTPTYADWSVVKKIFVILTTGAGGAASVSFDHMYLESSPLVGTELYKEIFNCENNTEETWSDNALLTNEQVYKGKKSVYVAGTAGGAARTATVTLTTSLDLSTWQDGNSVLDSDVFVFYVRTNDITALVDASCLQIKVGTDASNYYDYTWADKAALGLIGNDQWFKVSLTKDDLDASSTGSPDFTDIHYVAFVTSALTGTTKYLYIDYLTLRKNSSVTEICGMETGETWAFSNDQSGISTAASTNTSPGGVTEGSKCIQLTSPFGFSGEVTGTFTVAAPPLDLTVFPDSSVSTTDDFICLDVYVHNTLASAPENYLEIWFDCHDLSTFADAFKYRFEWSSFQPSNTYPFAPWGNTNLNYRGTISVPKSSFSRIGSTGAGAGWANIGAFKAVFFGPTNPAWPVRIYIDNVRLQRRPRNSGIYYYKYCFMINDVPSALSEISEAIYNDGTDILLSNLKTSADTRVTGRKVFRLGGSLDTWMELKTIDDNTTTIFVDQKNDNELILTMGEEIPQGYINSVVGNNLAYEPQSDRLMVWGDPTYKNRVWYSAQGYYLAFSASSYRDFNDEVMYVVPWYGRNIVFFRNHMQKVEGDISNGPLTDMPINVGACSYWAVKPLRNVIPFVSFDNVYILDGYNIIPIGDKVKGYFKGREAYLPTVNIGFNNDTIYIATRGKSGTQSYNNTVLRYYIPRKSWTVIPSWNVNVWSNWDQHDDANAFYYGDSVTGNIYSLNSGTYSFGSSAITSTLETGWIMAPDSEIAIHHIEFKAKGTVSSELLFYGYKDLSGSSACSGTITLTTSWVTYTIGPKNIHSLLRGDCLKLKFTHATAASYFYMKDVVICLEKIPKRITLNEVTIT